MKYPDCNVKKIMLSTEQVSVCDELDMRMCCQDDGTRGAKF